MMKIGATFGFALVILFVSFDIISSVRLTAGGEKVAGGYNLSTGSGFAQVTTTLTENREKTRECEEWKKHEITGQWKCAKFIVTTTN